MHELEQGQLERLRFAAQAHIPDHIIDEVSVEALNAFMGDMAIRLRASVWADKLEDSTHTEVATANFKVDTEQWKSVWQLWKHNRRDSKVFGWIARRWAPETVTETVSVSKTAQLKFRVCKYHTFPDFNPPGRFGNYYRYVKQDTLGVATWLD